MRVTHDGPNAAAAKKKMISRSATTIWTILKFVAPSATNQPVITPEMDSTIRMTQPSILEASKTRIRPSGTRSTCSCRFVPSASAVVIACT